MGRRRLRHLPRHGDFDDPEPALFDLLILCNEAVDRLGLGQTETIWAVSALGTVLHVVPQKRDGGLGLHILEMERVKKSHLRSNVLSFLHLMFLDKMSY